MEETVIEMDGVVISDRTVEINKEPRYLVGGDCCPYGPTTPPIKLQGDTIEEQMHHFRVICKQSDMCKSNGR